VSGAAPPRSTLRLYYAAAWAATAEAAAAFVAAEDVASLSPAMHPRRRAEHLAGRALLRFALQDWTGRPARSHRLRVAPTGKPECIDGPALSVAHSGELIVCALASQGRIGVDVEFPARGRSIDAIAARHFSAEESAWVAVQPPERFHMLWVLKEAYLKALGLGLAGGLGTLTCRIAPPSIDAAVTNSADVPALALYAASGAFVAIAALDQECHDVTVLAWTPDSTARPALDLLARTA